MGSDHDNPPRTDRRERITPRSPSEALQAEVVTGPRPSERARGKFVTFFSGVFTFIVLCFIAAGAALFVGNHEFEAPGPLDRDVAVVVPRGQGVQGIADALERNGVIGQSWLFVAGSTLYKASRDLKAGEYLFPEGVSMREVMDILREGRGIAHQITIPEGLTSKQIVDRLNADPILEGQITEIPPEGSLLPETYKYDRGTSRAQLIARMQQAHKRIVDQAWARRSPDLPLKTKEDLVTLASIVEKETGRADERPRVAGVFINRLRKNMRLQSDPTIIYGLVGGDGALGRPILRSEIDRPTAYNTYQINGLPPTPIANPGSDAIEAVANPSRTEELYFVADGTGGHIFAASLDEHNRNVARWREIAAKRAAEQAAAEEKKADEASKDDVQGMNTKTPAK
ncbi:MAG: endolytic transglycosylase MltG [Rhodobiaceae bacterium]|nr:endolytic transglycosylase MltG [Rhodobiaceae bacterium]MCC0056508.1 endolytic transglycosylase MltG [Rhodobiaceae bacterium]